MFNKPWSPRRMGFSLIELVVTIAVLSVAGLAVMAPFAVSAKGYGPARPSVRAQAAGLLQEQAELVTAQLDAIEPDGWAATVRSLALSSPIGEPGRTIDGTVFGVTRRFSCVAQDLATVDSLCSSGYVTVTVSVSPQGGEEFSASFVKTREGL